MFTTEESFFALTHFDGRNAPKLTALTDYFSEYAWDKYRVKIILEYLKFLAQNKIIPVKINFHKLNKIYTEFSLRDEKAIKLEEKITNHDLKAIINWLEKKFLKTGHKNLTPFINLGMGSEDINNVALRLQLKDSFFFVLHPEINKLLETLIQFIRPVIKLPMLARTHGQPASVTTLGKEMALFTHRLFEESMYISQIDFAPKFSGEVGNFNALKIIRPDFNWLDLEKKFLKTLGFENSSSSTQIAPYSDITLFFAHLKRLNAVLTGFCKDIWLYTAFGYFNIANIKNEVGSSGMPHKINPQYFEGAEGGLELANSLLEFFELKLSYNRLQRDFSDSTVRRNFVLPIAYSLLSYQSLQTGLKRLAVNEKNITNDLDNHWEVMSETAATILKFDKQTNVNQKIKNLMRGQTFNQHSFTKMVEELKLNNRLKNKLLRLAPVNLTGESENIANNIISLISRYLKQKIYA